MARIQIRIIEGTFTVELPDHLLAGLPAPADEKGALRPGEAAEWLNTSRDTVFRLIQRGELRSFKIGSARFISMSELRRFVAEAEAAP